MDESLIKICSAFLEKNWMSKSVDNADNDGDTREGSLNVALLQAVPTNTEQQ